MFSLSKVSAKDLIEFNRVFSLLLLSRLTISDSLEISLRQTKNKPFKEILTSILTDVKGGNSLAKSFGKHPEVFSGIYVANLRVAEETGKIAEVLTHYNDYIEKIHHLKKKLLQAALYPVVILSVAFGAVLFMLLFLIPSFESLFGTTDTDMPQLTALFISVSNGVSEYGYVIVAMMVGVPFVVYKLRNNQKVLDAVDSTVVKIPVVSTLYKKNLVARFSLSMAILLENGVVLVDGLKTAMQVTRNKTFRNEITLLIKNLIIGGHLSSSLSRSVFFDANFSRLLAAGEESAELEKVFKITGDHYSREFDYALEGITALVEPVLIVTVALVVGVLLVAMYLPLFEIINNFGV